MLKYLIPALGGLLLLASSASAALAEPKERSTRIELNRDRSLTRIERLEEDKNKKKIVTPSGVVGVKNDRDTTRHKIAPH